tara:strand:+ start:77 stop:1330 length:1254 start_codon:yes stop_codon:yes gene_type:complete
MSLKSEAIKRFLTAARSLANQGLSKEAIVQFAKNEFGEVTELFKKQIDNIFKKPASGIEKLKVKDEIFDDTIIKLPIDDKGRPFNPRDPLKDYSKELTDSPLDDLKKIIDDFEPMGPNKPRDKKYTGGLVDVEPSLSDIGHGSDALMARTRLMSPGSQMTTSTGLNYLLAEDNDNIRVPFANGNGVADEDAEKAALGKRVRELMDDGLDFGEAVKQAMSEGYAEGGRIGFSKGKLALKKLNKGRRKFMKAAGTGLAGLAALKTGLINLAKDAGPKVEAIKETVTSAPDYFFDLMRTIKMFGKQGTSVGERMNTTNYKNFELTEDLTTGDMRITKQKGDPEIGYEEEVMEYSPGGNPMEEGGMSMERYEEATLRPDGDGKLKDIEDGIEADSIKEIIEEINKSKTKKASGGLANLLGE